MFFFVKVLCAKFSLVRFNSNSIATSLWCNSRLPLVLIVFYRIFSCCFFSTSPYLVNKVSFIINGTSFPRLKLRCNALSHASVKQPHSNSLAANYNYNLSTRIINGVSCRIFFHSLVERIRNLMRQNVFVSSSSRTCYRRYAMLEWPDRWYGPI